MEHDLSLKNILRNQLSTVSFKREIQESPAPRSVANSFHRKKKFDTLKPRPEGPSMMYSKSDLLRMIFDND